MVGVAATALLAWYPVAGLLDEAEEATVAITGGTFIMGAEVEDDHRPPHEVGVGDFLMDRREVTNAEYTESPAENPTGPEMSKYRSVRGGGWHSGPYCTSVYR